MRSLLFNVFFVLSFTVIFMTIISLNKYYDAKPGNHNEFPDNDNFSISKCQQWTDHVRDFNVQSGKEAEKVTVLLYHRILNDQDVHKVHYDPEGNLYETIVLTSQFTKQMELLKEHDYTTLTAQEFKLFMDGKLEVPKNSIVLTFDDGFRDNYMEAYPILRKLNFTAINFLITANISKKTDTYVPEHNQYLTVKELRKSCDVFDFQSHTYNYHMRDIDNNPYLISKSKEEIIADIGASLVNLENRGFSFSYPYGAYDEETIEALQQLDVKLAFTVEYKDAMPGMSIYEVPRKVVFPDDSIEKFAAKINLSE